MLALLKIERLRVRLGMTTTEEESAGSAALEHIAYAPIYPLPSKWQGTIFLYILGWLVLLKDA